MISKIPHFQRILRIIGSMAERVEEVTGRPMTAVAHATLR
jgi:hypothetical protein